MNEPMVKSQTVRLWDIFVLGPFSIWFAHRATQMPAWARIALGTYGVGTMLYNGYNYFEYQRIKRQHAQANTP